MTEHYFSADPAVADVRQEVTARIWGRDLRFITARGVFSAGGLDKATAILLGASEPPCAARTVLDLGCGWGPIACAVALACPGATVHAVDTNVRALELTRLNAERLGVSGRVFASTPDEVPADAAYDAIWSNPPVRIGKAALHELLLRWLPRLADGASARLVVGKNLGADSLQRWLVEQGWPTDRAASAKAFRVLQVRRDP